MQINLQIVREVLRNGLGRDSFIASFVNRVGEYGRCQTTSISSDARIEEWRIEGTQ
jgi:hypothetical protein